MRQTNPSQIEETHTAGNGFIINCQYSKRLNQLPDKTIFKDSNFRKELVKNKMFLFYHSYLLIYLYPTYVDLKSKFNEQVIYSKRVCLFKVES